MKTQMEVLYMILALLALDAIWLTSNMTMHSALFAKLQGSPLTIRWVPAILVYVVIVGAVWFFAVRETKTVQDAALRGGLLGLSMYGVYDLTNYATLSKYPLTFAVSDMAWGTFLCATVAAVGALTKA
jgi:uncharacterized membrane protein